MFIRKLLPFSGKKGRPREEKFFVYPRREGKVRIVAVGEPIGCSDP